MQSDLKLKYFSGNEAESFSFYRIPKIFVKDDRFKGISIEAKFLYGIMLDRMSISIKNNWIDSQNRVFIYYKLENIMDDLQCGKEKASKLLKELDSKSGVGLIEKKRQGLGKPDIIYIKNFATIQYINKVDPSDNTITSKEEELDIDNFVENQGENTIEFGYKGMQSPDFQDSGIPISELPVYGKTNTNNTKINNTKGNDINLINQSCSLDEYEYPSAYMEDGTDKIDDPYPLNEEMTISEFKDTKNIGKGKDPGLAGYAALIRDNIDYDHEMNNLSYGDKELYENLYNIICDIMCNNHDTVRINKIDYPINVVRGKFMKLRSCHIYYVMEKINKTRTKISNIRNYLITALYNAPDTFEADLTAQVQYDLYGDN